MSDTAKINMTLRDALLDTGSPAFRSAVHALQVWLERAAAARGIKPMVALQDAATASYAHAKYGRSGGTALASVYGVPLFRADFPDESRDAAPDVRDVLLERYLTLLAIERPELGAALPTPHALTVFFYLLMRDHLPAGAVQQLVNDSTERVTDWQLSSAHIGRQAEQLRAQMLGAEHGDVLRLFKQQAVTIAQRGLEVVVRTDSADDADAVFNWLRDLE